MIANFRYKSSWEKFEETVNILKDLLKNKKAFWVIGYSQGLDIEIDDDFMEKTDRDILMIMNDEILTIVAAILKDGSLNEEKLRKSLLSADHEISEEEKDSIVRSVFNKLELVKDAFDIDRLAVRYQLKKESVNPKILNFEHNVFTHHFADGGKEMCALVSISTKKKLPDLMGQTLSSFFSNSEKENEISFLCDRDDIDLLIYQLKTIKKEMEAL